MDPSLCESKATSNASSAFRSTAGLEVVDDTSAAAAGVSPVGLPPSIACIAGTSRAAAASGLMASRYRRHASSSLR